MKKFLWLYIFAGVVICALALSHCGGTRYNNGSGYRASVPPNLIRVTDGQVIAFYSTSGALKNSISLGGSWGGGQPFAQNNITGLFYFGTNSVAANYVFYLSGLKASYQFSTLATSQMTLASGHGTSTGVAVNSAGTTLYVADAVNQVVTYLSAVSLSYAIGGSQINSVFAAPVGLGAAFVNYLNGSIIVTENVVGSAYFMNSVNGNAVAPAGGLGYLPLVDATTGCNAANLVNEVQVNPLVNTAYVLCGASVVYINMNLSTPNYLFGSLLGSTMATTGIASPTDIAYDSVDNSVFVVGGTILIALDGQSGSVTNSVDLSTYGCGTLALSLGGVTYSSATKKVYVADTANAQVYTLNPSTFGLATGACPTSVFTTGAQVSHPTKIGFY